MTYIHIYDKHQNKETQMADFQSEIPEEYLDSDFDFGFTAVDADELEQVTSEDSSSDGAVSSLSTSEVVNAVNDLESKINAVLLKLDSQEDNTFSGEVEVDMSRVEEKLDKILAMENQELMSAVSDQSESIRAVIDEVEERKGQLNEQYTVRMREVEKLVMPLLILLKKNPSKEYIYWPNRLSLIHI